jgi:hypothetical protein
MTNSQEKNINEDYLKELDDAIESLKKGELEILKLSRAVVIRFATQLRNNPNKEISSRDVKNFWEMARRGRLTKNNGKP